MRSSRADLPMPPMPVTANTYVGGSGSASQDSSTASSASLPTKRRLRSRETTSYRVLVPKPLSILTPLPCQTICPLCCRGACQFRCDTMTSFLVDENLRLGPKEDFRPPPAPGGPLLTALREKC